MDSKVLIFGNKLHNEKNYSILAFNGYEVEFQNFPVQSWPRLSNYSIIIVDYSPFEERGSLYSREQEFFEAQLHEALKKGTYICFLHYEHKVPRYDQYGYSNGYMNASDIRILEESQLGFKFLKLFSIRPFKDSSPLCLGDLKRSEFQDYLEKWGASKNYFQPYNNGNFDDEIRTFSNYATSFSLNVLNGKLIYLPCQINLADEEDTRGMFMKLISSLIIYRTKSRTKLPEWASTPIFKEEKESFDELKALRDEELRIKTKLEKYEEIKSLVFLSEYELEEKLVNFLGSSFNIKTKRSERYNEDFWILDEKGEKVAICEVKSTVNGFKRGFIYDAYNHRERADLEKDFPALLFITSNLSASNWTEKAKKIPGTECKIAVENNILIIRLEDLMYLWSAFINGELSKEKIMALFLNNSGWLHFNPDYSYEIVKN